MIDLALLRNSPQEIIEYIKRKDPSFDAQLLADLDKKLRQLRHEVEELRKKKNDLAKQARGGAITPELREQSIELGKSLKSREAELSKVEESFKQLYLSCPNIPQPDVPEGNKEANEVVKIVGSKPTYNFDIKNHVDLGNALGWFDFEAATRIAGSNFALYKGEAVKLMYALTMFMLKNNIKHGYEPIIPSYLVNEKSLYVTGNFPKFKEDVYEISNDNLFLTPTAEVNLANIYRDSILHEDELPKRMTAWTSCFRREAGTYGATERGLIRIHQFEKVELYTVCTPEQADNELKKMLECAESMLQQLGLHYRVSLLAAQDCSFPSAKTLDIEVWLPGQGEYYEVSSCSNCTDFQARRGLIRYKKPGDKKTQLLYTLNGSSLALPRLVVAIMETYQQPDGTIKIPDILKKEGIF